MLKDGRPLGAIAMARAETGRFPDWQIDLLRTFADQAAIAIENVRLFDEVQARTDDLTESLEQQTATSEVLKVISSSPGDLEPVFNAMLANATRICGADFANLLLYEGKDFRRAALHGPPEWTALKFRDPVVSPGSIDPLARAAQGRLSHIADIREEQAYIDRYPPIVALAEVAGARTLLMVPMLKDAELVGAIAIYRQEVRPFNDKQIELVQNFAAQAVIAIENARLLNELRQRTGDLSEALEQQTATSEVLKVISASPGELEPVFNAMLCNALRISGARFGVLFRCTNGVISPMAFRDVPAELIRFLQERGPLVPHSGTTMERLLQTKQVVHVEDVAKSDGLTSPTARLGGARSYIGVPMLKDNEVIGAFNIYRQEVQPFTDKQIELVQNFAAQAVIAIENTRLLNELRQTLERQTATSEVLRIISSSAGDPKPVFDAMLANAVRVCGSRFGAMYVREGDKYQTVALHGATPAFIQARLGAGSFTPGPGTGLARAVIRRDIVHIKDIRMDDDGRDDTLRSEAIEAGIRTLLVVPMLKEGGPSARSPSIVMKYSRSMTSRSSWSRTSPPKLSSRSRTRGC
jgi:GAF domain-containing protein